MLYLAWLHGGENPFRLYHALDHDYRPYGGGPVMRPAFPERVRALIYGFANQAQDEHLAHTKAIAGSR